MTTKWVSGFQVRIDSEQAAAAVVHHLMLAAMFHEAMEPDESNLILQGIDPRCPSHIGEAIKAFTVSLDKYFEELS